MAETERHGYGYHHGDLRNALVAAATELASEGGPGKIVLREAARRVGVSSTAAYRHFSSHGRLLDATKSLCQQALGAWIERDVEEEEVRFRSGCRPSTEDGQEDADTAQWRIGAIGRAYIRFALANPGLYRTAFVRTAPDERGHEEFDGLTPIEGADFQAFVQLTDTLDALVAAGRMRSVNRPGAEVSSWSLVHGLSLLILDGPLDTLPPRERDLLIDQVLDTLLAGLLS